MSAIGNFDDRPAEPRRLLRAYARLFAWKLSLHGVEAEGPGAHRRLAGAGDQRSPRRGLDRLPGPTPVRAAAHHPRSGPTGCSTAGTGDGCSARWPVDRCPTCWCAAERTPPFWPDDAGPDVPSRRRRSSRGLVRLRLGADRRGLGPRRRTTTCSPVRMAGCGCWPAAAAAASNPGSVAGAAGATRRNIAAVGDWNGDGRPDLVARSRKGSVWLHPGRGRDGFGAAYKLRNTVGSPTVMLGVGRWNGDGAPDLMTRSRDGRSAAVARQRARPARARGLHRLEPAPLRPADRGGRPSTGTGIPTWWAGWPRPGGCTCCPAVHCGWAPRCRSARIRSPAPSADPTGSR